MLQDYRKSADHTVVNQLGPVTYEVKVGDLIWKQYVDQICAQETDFPTGNQCSVSDGDLCLPVTMTVPYFDTSQTNHDNLYSKILKTVYISRWHFQQTVMKILYEHWTKANKNIQRDKVRADNPVTEECGKKVGPTGFQDKSRISDLINNKS